jgi:hypothetical protein
MAPQRLADNDAVVFKSLNIKEKRAVIPDKPRQRRRSGIHSGALASEVPAWIPGLLAVARDDGAFRDEISTD